jgi:hypothetical protein
LSWNCFFVVVSEKTRADKNAEMPECRNAVKPNCTGNLFVPNGSDLSSFFLSCLLFEE